MKAWRVEKHGAADGLKRAEIPTPEAGPGEVRVKVEAVGLNHMDLWVQRGVPGHHFPLPMTPGCDVAGIVDQMGPGTEKSLTAAGIQKGTPVVVNPGVTCGRCEACLGGFDPICSQFGLIGEHRDGGCADYIVVPSANIVQRPANLSAVDAAAIPIAYLTAWTMLHRKAQLKPGETVLIQAGGSGVSAAGIQIAKQIGATVITTVGSDDKIDRAKSLGADYVINYKTSSFREEVKKILSAQGKKGVEVVFDHVGGETFQESMKCLAWGGRIVTCGATAGGKVEINLQHLFFKNISVLGSTMGSKADLIRIVALVASGKLKPVIDSTFSMSQYPDAVKRLENRAAFGKIIVKA